MLSPGATTKKGKEEIVYETCDSGSSDPNQLTTGTAGGMRQAPRRGHLETLPVCVPVPETRMLSGIRVVLSSPLVAQSSCILVFILTPDWLKFLFVYLLSSFLCVIESGTGSGTGLRPRHGHEFSLETAEPVVYPFQATKETGECAKTGLWPCSGEQSLFARACSGS